MKQKILCLILAITLICGVFTGCGSSGVSNKESEKIFSAYAEFYEEFFEEHKTSKFVNEDFPEEYSILLECAGKIVLDENNKPMLVIADFVNGNNSTDNAIFDVYFYTYEKGKVTEQVKIKNVECDTALLVYNLNNSVVLLSDVGTTREGLGLYTLTKDSYESDTVDDSFETLKDYGFSEEVFDDMTYFLWGSAIVEHTRNITCLNSDDFVDYLDYFSDKSIKTQMDLHILERDYYVDNRYCDDFNLYVCYDGYDYMYYDPSRQVENSVDSTEWGTEDLGMIEYSGVSIDEPVFILQTSVSGTEGIEALRKKEIPDKIDGIPVCKELLDAQLTSLEEYYTDAEEKNKIVSLYGAFIRDNDMSGFKFDAIDIDNNGIEELVYVGDSTAAGSGVLAYHNGEIIDNHMEYDFPSVSKSHNKVAIAYGRRGYYGNRLYHLENGELVVDIDGEWTEEYSEDMDGLVYTYKINGKDVSQEEYNEICEKEIYAESYNFRIFYPENMYSYSKIISDLRVNTYQSIIGYIER